MAKRSIALLNDDLVDCCQPLTSEVIGEDEAHDVSLIFGALGDPIRLRLFSLIASSDEVCSCNLEEPLGKSQPTISHHTRILSEVGLIAGEKRGRWTYWRVVPERLSVAAKLLG